MEVYRDSGAVDLRVLDAFEQLAGFRLPQTYRALLSAHNVGLLYKPMDSTQTARWQS